LWLCGLLLEAGAVAALLQQRLMAAALLHVASAAALAYAAVDGQRRQRGQTALPVFLWAVSLPALGPLGMCLVMLPAWRALRPGRDDGLQEIDLPDLAASLANVESRAVLPVEAVLECDSPEQERVESVMALRTMEAERAVPLLRMALLDPYEEVRLLAYGILERREKHLRARIDASMHEFETDAAERGANDRRAVALQILGESHWELVHGGFVKGEFEAATLDLAMRYGHAAFEFRPHGSLALLLARIRLRQGDAAGAQQFLRTASDLGVASSVLAPFYAEVAFISRRFDEVAPLLTNNGAPYPSRPRLDAVVRFWTGRGGA
jgi:hypothetical protein